MHQLKTLITKYKHTEKLIEEKNKNLIILNEQYTAELSRIRPNLPESLIENISTLLKEDIPPSNIIRRVRDSIPEDIPAWVLEEYISIFMMKSCEKKQDST